MRGHNLLLMEDNIVVANDTFGQTVCTYDLEHRKLLDVIDLKQCDWIRRLRQSADRINLPRRLMIRIGLRKESIPRPLFARGLDRDGDHLFVGLSPASITCINWRTGEFIDDYQYDPDHRACVHGLAVIDRPRAG